MSDETSIILNACDLLQEPEKYVKESITADNCKLDDSVHVRASSDLYIGSNQSTPRRNSTQEMLVAQTNVLMDPFSLYKRKQDK